MSSSRGRHAPKTSRLKRQAIEDQSDDMASIREIARRDFEIDHAKVSSQVEKRIGGKHMGKNRGKERD